MSKINGILKIQSASDWTKLTSNWTHLRLRIIISVLMMWCHFKEYLKVNFLWLICEITLTLTHTHTAGESWAHFQDKAHVIWAWPPQPTTRWWRRRSQLLCFVPTADSASDLRPMPIMWPLFLTELSVKLEEAGGKHEARGRERETKRRREGERERGSGAWGMIKGGAELWVSHPTADGLLEVWGREWLRWSQMTPYDQSPHSSMISCFIKIRPD